jgi:hypothetical protein
MNNIKLAVSRHLIMRVDLENLGNHLQISLKIICDAMGDLLIQDLAIFCSLTEHATF